MATPTRKVRPTVGFFLRPFTIQAESPRLTLVLGDKTVAPSFEAANGFFKAKVQERVDD